MTSNTHVNVQSYLATLHSDQLFAAGKSGPPAEISGFALLSNTAADQFVALAQHNGMLDKLEGDIPLQVPGTAHFDDGHALGAGREPGRGARFHGRPGRAGGPCLRPGLRLTSLSARRRTANTGPCITTKKWPRAPAAPGARDIYHGRVGPGRGKLRHFALARPPPAGAGERKVPS